MAELTTEDIGLRERKKLETRRVIRRVALDLALEVGVEKLTVEAIIQRAGISRRTFFNYFAHKEDALVTDGTAIAEALRPKIIARPAEESPFRAIRSAISTLDIFAALNTDRDRMMARQKLVQQHPVLVARQLNHNAHLEQALVEAVAKRLEVDAQDDLRPALIASVAGSAMRVALQWWSVQENETLGHVLVTALDMLEQGLLTQAATGSVGTPVRTPGKRPFDT